jgi:hypothetical protein
MHPHLTQQLAVQHVNDMRSQAIAARRARQARRARRGVPITVRRGVLSPQPQCG